MAPTSAFFCGYSINGGPRGPTARLISDILSREKRFFGDFFFGQNRFLDRFGTVVRTLVLRGYSEQARPIGFQNRLI